MEELSVNKPFIVREKHTEAVVRLLKSVTLGSNGTHYQHQRIDERIAVLYKPIYVNLERNDKVLGNITFCRRPQHWYVRYFAFDLGVQSGKKRPRSNANSSGLKQRMNTVFESAFQLSVDAPDSFYAYIDPKNERSLWMSQDFHFKTVGKIATQTFSRVNPRFVAGVEAQKPNDFIRQKVAETYGHYPFYFTHHTFNDSPFYTLKESGKIVAFAKVHQGEWKISRLSGRWGGVLQKLVPFIPGLRKIVRPDRHIFSVVDSLWCPSQNSAYLQELFEGILYHEKTNSLIWWVDVKEKLYQSVRSGVKWGLLHRFNGVQEVDLVVRAAAREKQVEFSGPTYVTGIDFV